MMEYKFPERIVLCPEDFDEFSKNITSPGKPNARLIKLLRGKLVEKKND